jgi:hypothetical protein
MERVRLDFDATEFEALSRLADRNLRPIPNEARHIVRQALQDAGLLRQSSESTDAPDRYVGSGR